MLQLEMKDSNRFISWEVQTVNPISRQLWISASILMHFVLTGNSDYNYNHVYFFGLWSTFIVQLQFRHWNVP